jgi:hypothetical protein
MHVAFAFGRIEDHIDEEVFAEARGAAGEPDDIAEADLFVEKLFSNFCVDHCFASLSDQLPATGNAAHR